MSRIVKFTAVLWVLVFFRVGKCANILVVLPGSGYSQYLLAESLIVTLGQRGHHLTVIGCFETPNAENVKNIVVEYNMPDIMSNNILLKLQDFSLISNIIMIHKLGLQITEQLLANPQVQKLLNSNQKFDLVIVETFFNEAHQAFSTHFKAHKILFHSMSVSDWNSHMIGLPNLPSYLPNSFVGYTTHMNFVQRLRNTLATWFDRLYQYYIHHPAHQKLIDKYFPVHYDLDEVIYNTSVMLTCSHAGSSEAQPLTSGIIEVGGLHIVPRQLPSDLESFLNSSGNGVIFFSLGSNVQSASLGKKLVEELLKSLGSLKQKILWKFEGKGLKDVPDNVMISKWFPQSDVLAHPNTILFISHCGMGSTTEAIHHGVPVICIPLYADQFTNSQRLQLFGMGVELPFKQLSESKLTSSITEALSNRNYRDNAIKRSKIFKDRPVKALELAVYWVEYVLRHDGALHLQNSILNLKWYQLYSIDVILALLTCVWIGYFVVLRVFNIFRVKKKRD